VPVAPARTFSRLGDDLALTRFVGTPSAVPLESADSWGSLDLAVVAGRAATDDLGAVHARETLGQALILRLLTPRGSLAPLGHPDYGSRLVELIGRRNDEATRNLVRLHTLAALGHEPRVQAVVGLDVQPAPGQPDTVLLSLAVRPVDDASPLALSLEVAL